MPVRFKLYVVLNFTRSLLASGTVLMKQSVFAAADLDHGLFILFMYHQRDHTRFCIVPC